MFSSSSVGQIWVFWCRKSCDWAHFVFRSRGGLVLAHICRFSSFKIIKKHLIPAFPLHRHCFKFVKNFRGAIKIFKCFEINNWLCSHDITLFKKAYSLTLGWKVAVNSTVVTMVTSRMQSFYSAFSVSVISALIHMKWNLSESLMSCLSGHMSYRTKKMGYFTWNKCFHHQKCVERRPNIWFSLTLGLREALLIIGYSCLRLCCQIRRSVSTCRHCLRR